MATSVVPLPVPPVKWAPIIFIVYMVIGATILARTSESEARRSGWERRAWPWLNRRSPHDRHAVAYGSVVHQSLNHRGRMTPRGSGGAIPGAEWERAKGERPDMIAVHAGGGTRAS